MTDAQFEKIIKTLEILVTKLDEISHNTSGGYYNDANVEKTNKLLEKLIDIMQK